MTPIPPSAEEILSRLMAIPEEYHKLAVRVFGTIGQARVVEILKSQNPLHGKYDVRQQLGIGRLEVNAAFDVLALIREHQHSRPAPKSTRKPRTKVFVTGANGHLLRQGSLVTVDGVSGIILSQPARTTISRGLWASEFEWRKLGDSPTVIKKGVLDVNSVIRLSP